MTVLSTNIAIDLGLLGTTDNELLTVNTAGGSVQVNMNYLSSLTVGNAQAENVAVAIHDLPDIPEQIEGLLGMSFLKHFLITLDAEHSRLILRPKPSSSSYYFAIVPFSADLNNFLKKKNSKWECSKNSFPASPHTV